MVAVIVMLILSSSRCYCGACVVVGCGVGVDAVIVVADVAIVDCVDVCVIYDVVVVTAVVVVDDIDMSSVYILRCLCCS